MNGHVFVEWLSEPKAVQSLPQDVNRDLFLDSDSDHNHSVAVNQALQNIDTELSRLPTSTTEKTQPLDSFIIREFKRIWNFTWDEERKRRIEQGLISEGSG